MRILVTGGTGSFGNALARRIAHNVDRFVVYSRSEHKQEEMARGFHSDAMRYFIGDVRDLERLKLAMRGIDVVVHAAALKVVPVCEYNPTEAVATNILGIENVIKAALSSNVTRVVALSTDKACNPINLYGATKLAAEKIAVAANNLAGDNGPCFAVVRYGNVADSAGSVLPFFRKLAEAGKPLPITDLRMTRFWMTLEQAVDFVLRCLDDMQGREIFVPKLPSVRVLTMASAVARHYDSTQQRDVVGIRPGEKLHETLVTTDESRHSRADATRFCIHPDWVGEEHAAYTSGENDRWVTIADLQAHLQGSLAAPKCAGRFG